VTFDIGPGGEEELPQPGPTNNRRLRRDLLIGGGLLVGVLVVGRAISTGEHKPNAAVATRTTQASLIPPPPQPTTPIVPASSSVLLTRGNGSVILVAALPERTSDNPAVCPAHLSCFTQEAVPGTVLDAVKAVFPGARLLSESTVRLLTNPWAGSVWFRQLSFRVLGSRLQVVVSTPGPTDAPGSGTTGTGVVYYRSTFQQYLVAAQIGPGSGGSVEKLRRLAHDERLLTT
jgi:hypothetical protein